MAGDTQHAQAQSQSQAQGANLFPQRRRRRHFTSGLASRLFSVNNPNPNTTTHPVQHHHHHHHHQNHISLHQPLQDEDEDLEVTSPISPPLLRGGFRRDRQGNALMNQNNNMGSNEEEENLNHVSSPNPTSPHKMHLPQPHSPRTASSRKSTRTEQTEPILDHSFESSDGSPYKNSHHHHTSNVNKQGEDRATTPKQRRGGTVTPTKSSHRPLAESMDKEEVVYPPSFPMFPATSPHSKSKVTPTKKPWVSTKVLSMPMDSVPHDPLVDDSSSLDVSSKLGESSNDSAIKTDSSVSPEPYESSSNGPLHFRIQPPEEHDASYQGNLLQQVCKPSPRRLKYQQQIYKRDSSKQINSNSNNHRAESVTAKQGGLAQGIEMLLHPMQKWVQCAAPVGSTLEGRDHLLAQPIPLQKASSTISTTSTEVATNRAVDLTRRRIQEMEQKIELRRVEAQIQQQQLQRHRKEQEEVAQDDDTEEQSLHAMEQPEDESIPTDMSVPTDEGDVNRQKRVAKHYRKGQEDDGDEPPMGRVVAHHKPRYSFGPPLVPPRYLEQRSILSVSDDESSRMTQSTTQSSQAPLTRFAPPTAPPKAIVSGRRKFQNQVDFVPGQQQGRMGTDPESSSLPSTGMSMSSSVGVEIDSKNPYMDQSKARGLYAAFRTGQPLQPLEESGFEDSPPRSQVKVQRQEQGSELKMPKLSLMISRFEGNTQAGKNLSPAPATPVVPKSTILSPKPMKTHSASNMSPKSHIATQRGKRVTQTRAVGGGLYMSPARLTGRIPEVGEDSPDPVFCSKSISSNHTWDNNTVTTNSELNTTTSSTLDRDNSFDSSVIMNQSKSSQINELEVVRETVDDEQNGEGPGLADLAVMSAFAHGGLSSSHSKGMRPKPEQSSGRFENHNRPNANVGKRWPPKPISILEKATNQDEQPEQPEKSLYQSTPAFAVMSSLRKDTRTSPQKQQGLETSENISRSTMGVQRNRKASSFNAAVSVFEKKGSQHVETATRRSPSKLGSFVSKNSVFEGLDAEETSVGVKSLLSAFESVASHSLEEQSLHDYNEDDDTASVKSLKEIFETPDEPVRNGITKMREMFETKAKPASKPFQSGTVELQEAFMKFQSKRHARDRAKRYLSASKKDTGPTASQPLTPLQGPPSPQATDQQESQSPVRTLTREPKFVSVAERVRAFRARAASKPESHTASKRSIAPTSSRKNMLSPAVYVSEKKDLGKNEETNTQTDASSGNNIQSSQPSEPDCSSAEPAGTEHQPSQQSNQHQVATESSISKSSPGKKSEFSDELGEENAATHPTSKPSQDKSMTSNLFKTELQSKSTDASASQIPSKSPSRERFAQAAMATRDSHSSLRSSRHTSLRMVAHPITKKAVSSPVSERKQNLVSQSTTNSSFSGPFATRPVFENDSMEVEHSSKSPISARASSSLNGHSLQLKPQNQSTNGEPRHQDQITSFHLSPGTRAARLAAIKSMGSPGRTRDFRSVSYNGETPSNQSHSPFSRAETAPESGVVSSKTSTMTARNLDHDYFRSPQRVQSSAFANSYLSPTPSNTTENKVLLRNSISKVQPMKDRRNEYENPLSPGMSASESDFSDGVTLDVSIAEVSGLTLPTALLTKSDDRSMSTADPHEEDASSVPSSRLDIDDTRRSEASSSQTPEILAPLIARAMKTSDEVSMGDSFFSARAHAVKQRDREWGSSSAVKTSPLDDFAVAHEEKKTDEGSVDNNGVVWDADRIGSVFPAAAPTSQDLFQIDSDWRSFTANTDFAAPVPEEQNESPGRMSRSKTPVICNTGDVVDFLPQREQTHSASSAVPRSHQVSFEEQQKRGVLLKSNARLDRPAHVSSSDIPPSIKNDKSPTSPPTHQPSVAAPKTPDRANTGKTSLYKSRKSYGNVSLVSVALSKHRNERNSGEGHSAEAHTSLPQIPEALLDDHLDSPRQQQSTIEAEEQLHETPKRANGNRPIWGQAKVDNAAIFARLRMLKESRIRRANTLYYSNPAPDEESCSTKSSTQFGGSHFLGSLHVD